MLPRSRPLVVLAASLMILLSPSQPVAGRTPEAGVHRAPQAQGRLTDRRVDQQAIAWISSALPDANYGGLGYMWVGYGPGSGAYPGQLRGLVQFDLSWIPPTDTVTSARLYATILDSQGPEDEFAYYVGRIREPWDEDEVTWSSRPNASWYGNSTDVRVTGGQISWDVTDAIQEQHSGSRDVHGLYFKREDEDTNPQIHARMLDRLQLYVTHAPMVELEVSDRWDPVPSGGEIDYEIRLTNRAEFDIANARLADVVGGDVQFVSASDGGVFDSGLVTWDLPSFQAGASRTFHVTLRAQPGLPGGYEIHNAVSVSTCSGPRGAYCQPLSEASETTTVIGLRPRTPTTEPCLLDEAGDTFIDATPIELIQVARAGGRICPGSDEDWYQIDAVAGQIVAAALVLMEADFDLQLVAPTGETMDTSARPGRADEFVRGRALAPGAWRVRVYAASPDSASGSYQLLVSRTAPPTTPEPPALEPELELQTWLNEDHPLVGGTVHYGVRVTNIGTGAVENLQVQDALPDRVEHRGSDPEGGYEDPPEHRVTWTAETLGPGESLTFEITASVRRGVDPGATLRNDANAVGDNAEQVHAECVDTVVGEGVTVAPWVATSPVYPGEPIEIRANVCNEGAEPVSDIVASATLSTRFSHVVASPGSDISPFGTVDWTLASLDALACEEIWFTADLSANLSRGDELTIPWQVTVAGETRFEMEQSFEVDAPIPELSLSYELEDDTLYLYESTRITATVGVAGARAEDLVLTFTLSPHLSPAGNDPSCEYDTSYDQDRGVRFVCPLDGAEGQHRCHIRPMLSGSYRDDALWIDMAVEARGVPQQTVRAELDALSDLTVEGMEVTQSIQTYPGNSVRLVTDRKTWVRVYVVSQPGPTYVHDCTLRGYRCDGSGCNQALGSLDPEPIPDDTIRERYLTSTFDRGDGNHDFQFVLPDTWVAGEIELEPEVNPRCGTIYGDHDYNCGNNVGERVHINFVPRRANTWSRMDGYYWIDPENHVGRVVPSIDALDDMLRFVRGSWPLAAFVSHGSTSPGRMRSGDYDFTTEAGWTGALTELGALHTDCSGSHCDDRWVLVLPPFPAGYGDLWANGISDMGLNIIVAEEAAEDVLAHELGHSFGLFHSGCPAAGQPDAPDYVDPDMPVQIGQYGFNVVTREIRGPDTYEVMSYCDPTWPSIYSYNRVLDARSTSASLESVAQDPTSPAIVVAGRVSLDGGEGSIDNVSTRELPGGPFDQPGSGPFAIELADAGGTVMYTRQFTPTVALPLAPASKHAKSGGTFRELLPPRPGLAEIRLAYKGQVLDTRDVSANAPQVTLLVPNGGELVDGVYTARWSASDPDGDTLSYSLQYSPDDGASWRNIASGLTVTEYEIETDLLPGSDAARMRVAANDGARTAHDESDGTFRVPDHPPSLRIVQPDQGARVREGQTVFLQAHADDVEDEAIGDGVAWQSNRDGELGSGLELAVTELGVGVHEITASVTDRGGQSASAGVEMTVVAAAPEPDQCNEILDNGDFEEPGWGAWHAIGAQEPRLVRTKEPPDNRAALLGARDAGGLPGDSAIRQVVALPEGTRSATLRFRYTVQSTTTPDEVDLFVAALLDDAGNLLQVLRRQAGQSPWQTIEVDVGDYAGSAFVLHLGVYNDGQVGQSWAYVDDVSVCITRAEPLSPEPTGCWLQGDIEAGAPSGLPDFDQHQHGWQTPDTQQWSHDGPAAMADLLWWRDAYEESRLAEPPGPEGGYPLVQAYGAWHNGNAANVPPFVMHLANRFGTNASTPGTNLSGLVTGVREHLTSAGLSADYDVTLRKTPSFDWVREEAIQQRQVLLLLGFYEVQSEGLRRLGGHYTAVAGVSCTGDRIAFSDPWRDGAEAGGPGRVLPDEAHHHPAVPPDRTHNDPAFVSHDVYGVMRFGAAWGPQGYARTGQSAMRFFGLNTGPGLADLQAESYEGGEVFTLVDYALVVAPRTGLVTLALTPSRNTVHAGEVFAVQLEARSDIRAYDRVHAHLDFDPKVLQAVDSTGAPATALEPGGVLASIVTNRVDNAMGHIDFVAQGDATSGRRALAGIRFRAITSTQGSAIVWSDTGLRRSDLLREDESRLQNTVGASVVAAVGARAAGTVGLQGRGEPPDSTWVAPLTITLRRSGEPAPAYAYRVQTSDEGAFVLPGVVPSGKYYFRARGSGTLANLAVPELAPGTNTVRAGILLAGDAIADNRIDVLDLSLLASSYGFEPSAADYDARADLDDDDAVGPTDAALLRHNYGRSGDVFVASEASVRTVGLQTARSGAPARATRPWSLAPAGYGLVAPAANDAAEALLTIAPTTTLAAAGGLVTTEIWAETGAGSIDAAAVHLLFDPRQLAVVRLEVSEALPHVFQRRVDNGRGEVDLVVAQMGGETPVGKHRVASVQWRVLQIGTSWIRFGFSQERRTNLARKGASVLQSVRPAAIRAEQFQLFLPAAPQNAPVGTLANARQPAAAIAR